MVWTFQAVYQRCIYWTGHNNNIILKHTNHWVWFAGISFFEWRLSLNSLYGGHWCGILLWLQISDSSNSLFKESSGRWYLVNIGVNTTSSTMAVAVSVVLATVLLGPVAYFLYRFALFVLDVRRRGKAVNQFPGEPKHWLWGHVHLVRTTFLNLNQLVLSCTAFWNSDFVAGSKCMRELSLH